MKCKYTLRGETKQKRKFDTLDAAIHEAKMLNAARLGRRKMTAYKCPECHKYHIGKTPYLVKLKDFKKYQKYAADYFKKTVIKKY